MIKEKLDEEIYNKFESGISLKEVADKLGKKQEDLVIIQNFCPTINEWNNSKESVYSEDGTCLYNADYWNDRQCSSEILQRLSMPVFEIIDKYIKKMQSALEEIYCVELLGRPPVIMKWRPGIEQRPH